MELTQFNHSEILERYTVRPTRMEDKAAFCRLLYLYTLAMGDAEDLKPEDIDWTMPHYDLATSSIVLEDKNGEMIAYANLWDNSDIPIRNYTSWAVHPEHWHQGIEEFILEWLEKTAERAIPRCPDDAQVSLLLGTPIGFAQRESYYQARGYRFARVFQRRVITMTEAPPPAQFPEGFYVRSYRHPEELEDFVRLFTDSFRDHFGWVDEPFEKEVEVWRHELENDPIFDPLLCYLVVDSKTEALAGFCFCRRELAGRPDMAYVNELGVGKAYRKQGIALNMLYHAFGEFWKQGRAQVGLNVDSESLTGANRLYERAGMSVEKQWAQYEKILRTGRILANV